MSYQERRIALMAARHNERLLNEHLDGQEAREQREESIDAYVTDNMNDRILAWLDDAEEGVLLECVSETSAEETNDAVAAKMIRLIASGDDGVDNYYLLGKAFYQWIHKGMEDALEPGLRDEAEKELSD